MTGFVTTLRTSRSLDIKTAVDAGAGAGSLKFYDGVQPATGGATTNLVVDMTLVDPVAPDPVSGVLSFSSTAPANVLGNDTITWARLEDSDANFVADYSVGLIGSGADIEVDDVDLEIGGTLALDSLVLTEGNT